jgi:hypothetical protein
LASPGAGRTEATFQIAALGGVLVTGAVLAATSLKLPLICPLRIVTGIPCPLCGMTTGTVAVLRGDLGGAVGANPFSLAVPISALGGILDRLRLIVKNHPRREWSRRARRFALVTFTIASTVSWIFQLFRFDVL